MDLELILLIIPEASMSDSVARNPVIVNGEPALNIDNLKISVSESI